MATHAPLPDGTRRPTAKGYVQIKVAGRWMLEHRHVMEQRIGRKLLSSEIVHHDDEDPTNNAIENLILCSGLRDHLDRFHKKDLKNPPRHHNGRKPKGSPGYVPIGESN